MASAIVGKPRTSRVAIVGRLKLADGARAMFRVATATKTSGGATMTRFNETVGSYERSVLTAARRFDDLGVAETPVPEPPALEATVRTLRPAEARLDAADDDEAPSRDGTTG